MNNIVYLYIAANVLFSLQGFNQPQFVQKYIFNVSAILSGKQYYRLFTSAFLHANWGHLLFNMITLFFFGRTMVYYFGAVQFSVIYFVSLLGGNLLALYLKKDQPYYSALGASGAVSGILYAFILPFPWEKIYFFFIPIGIPAWLFGLLFIAISIFGMSRNADNIGHEAHLGGAISGFITFIVLQPAIFFSNIEIGLAILVPTVIFLVLIIRKPEILSIGKKDNWQRWD
ncbi:MAG: rhomboid family intramembrane serine protease [Schleiferiaceae bacterium]|nr:rhomboid family intramembrane serine protease [Schleiferiaceae bacterium]